MWARVSTYDNPPDTIDEGWNYVHESILPKVRQLPGFRGIYGLTDRQTGKTMSITLWESAEDLRASEADADRLRADATEQAGGGILGVERFEVTINELA